MTATAGTKRVFGLDVLRAIAILTVVYAHGRPIVAHRFPNYGNFDIDGVTIFFVLSGYLIGNILIRDFQRREPSFSILFQFWTRRWLRTLPAYLVVLTVLLLATFLLGDETPPKALLYYLFSQNIAWPHPNFFPELWSLAVEEWFYLLIPLLLFGLLKTRVLSLSQALWWLIVTIIVLAVYARIGRISMGDINTLHEWDISVRKVVVMRLDSLMFGVLGAWFSVFRPKAWSAQKTLLFSLGLVVFALNHTMNDNETWRNYFMLSAVPGGALLVLPLLSSWNLAPFRFLQVVTFISLISYSLYLVHLSLVKNILMNILNSFLPMPTAFLYITYWTLSLALAYLCYRFVERPFMKIRDANNGKELVSTNKVTL